MIEGHCHQSSLSCCRDTTSTRFRVTRPREIVIKVIADRRPLRPGASAPLSAIQTFAIPPP
jgi:hypothetical protein